MNLIVGAFPFFVLPFVLSLILVPICKQIGFKLGIYALENNRTVHHGKIVRMGGVALFVAFMVAMAVYVKADQTINGILIGGIIVFLGGIIDDIYNLKPLYKLLFEIAGALVALIYGQLYIQTMYLPFGIEISNLFFNFFVSFMWIVGVTNAINLIDGLDGLSSGISFIVTCVIGILGFFLGRRDICIMALILAGSTLGFLPYNFHPASIFMGDCGALFLGYMLACMGLLGFKTAAIVTLAFPIIMLFIPISDTLMAIIRRKLQGKKISEADRGHLHHTLMFKLGLGHRNTVIVLYIVTFLFGISAIIMYFDEIAGLILFIILLIGVEIFIEKTGMINEGFHPLTSLCQKFFSKKD